MFRQACWETQAEDDWNVDVVHRTVPCTQCAGCRSLPLQEPSTGLLPPRLI